MRRHHTAIALTLLSGILGGCLGTPAPTGSTAAAGSATAAAEPATSTSPGDAAPATGATAVGEGLVDADGAAAPLPATVEVVQPDFLVDTDSELDDSAIARVEQLPGLEAVARVARAEVQIVGPTGETSDSILVVDPADFRPLTPDVTAQAVGVWERLAAGDVIVRHDVANELGLELGGTVLLATEDTSRVARVGAFAANGTPPVAAVLVPWSLAREFGIERPNGLVLAVGEDALEETTDALDTVLAGARVERREAPRPQTSSVATAGSAELTPFTFTDFGDGTIAIDPAWVQANIVTVEIPGIATTRCHKVMVPQLLAALEEIQALGLYDHFKPEQFGGCWVPRRIDWDPSKPLSNHAWGIAIDLNTHDNWLGDVPQMDRRIVEVFEKWGFEWGGNWARPDGMHFELDRIVRPADG